MQSEKFLILPFCKTCLNMENTMLTPNLKIKNRKKEYDWEEGLIKTWEALPKDKKEKDKKKDIRTVSNLIEKAKQLRLEQRDVRNRLGLMRKLFILIDFSESMIERDFKPSRLGLTFKYLRTFVPDFIRANPLSQVGIVKLYKSSAYLLSKLSCNPAEHLQAMKHIKVSAFNSEISILNGLEIALEALRIEPPHFSREILIIMSAVGSCDPAGMPETMEALAEAGIRVHIISLSVEVNICKKLTKRTKGNYSIVFNEKHFHSELMAHVESPLAIEQQKKVLIKMGFPHLEFYNEMIEDKSAASGYACPQCSTLCYTLPNTCGTCGLMMVTVPQLARSYHHLFPVKAFQKVRYNAQAALCFACQKEFSMRYVYSIYHCELCKKYFCKHCAIFIHETLHACVGCSCTNPSY